ncbi:MAB_1171c family putative transporter [Nocardia sp. NPDC051570]|uniref:MAB_1171c family putative transporter n=1 Tax=Nocardia sp. NPDC051570 TaxID=3364324 RepID=UPI0037ADEC99
MIEFKNVVFPICAALCYLAALYKLRDLQVHRGRNDTASWTLLSVFVSKALGYTLAVPRVAKLVDDYSGVPNLGALLIHLFEGIFFSGAVLITLVLWVYEPKQARRIARHRLLVIGLVAAAMVGLWLIAFDSNRPRSPHYIIQEAHRPEVAVYSLIYVGALLIASTEIIRLALTFSRRASDRWIRSGLRLMGAGSAVYLINIFDRGSAVFLVMLDFNPLQWELIVPIGALTGTILTVVGLTIPSWGPSIEQAYDWLISVRAHHRLYPLWRALVDTTPGIALTAPQRRVADSFNVTDIRYRLYRRVIEIQDGLLALQLPTALNQSTPRYRALLAACGQRLSKLDADGPADSEENSDTRLRHSDIRNLITLTDDYLMALRRLPGNSTEKS